MAFGTITASFLNFLPTPALDCERHRRRISMLAGFSLIQPLLTFAWPTTDATLPDF